MQKYQYAHRKIITGLSTLFGFLFPVLVSCLEPISNKVLERQLGERIDKMENIIPVMERSKAIDISLPYFNRYPHFTEQLIGQAVLYFPVIEQILRQYGLPEDLKYIPFFESGFREDARSPAGAVGLWQFMEGTGRKYGLVINREIDERMDFVKSTEAAARFLKSLHEEFGCWALALMAYNGGQYRVKRLVLESNSTNIQKIMNLMPEESQTYLSKMIAAKLIFKTYKFYGLTPRIPEPVDLYNINATYITSLDLTTISKEHQVDYTALRQANPHLKLRKIRNADHHTINVRIPKYSGKSKDDHFFRSQTYYITSQEQLENLASILNLSSRKIELMNEFFDPVNLVGKLITLRIPSPQYMSIDKQFGFQPVDFLSRDFNLMKIENLASKILPSSNYTIAISESRTLYYLRPSESLLDVTKRLEISLERIKELNPDMDLFQSNRFYIPQTITPNEVVSIDMANAL